MTGLDPLAIALSGVQVIEASAGTGKTHTIGTLWLRLIVEQPLPVDRILVVTFTRTATAELRLKLRERLREALAELESSRRGHAPDDGARDPGATAAGALDGGPSSPAADAGEDATVLERLVARWAVAPGSAEAVKRLRAALAELDQAAIHTIHGFCQRALQEHAFECRMPPDAAFLEAEASDALLEEAVADWWATRLPGAEREVVAAFRASYRAPGDLMALARKAASAAPPRLLGAEPWDEPDALAAALEARRAAWDAAAACWREGTADVARILLDDPGLNRSSYQRPSVATWLVELDALLAGEPDGLPKWFGKLAAESVAGAAKKGKTVETHPFFDACTTLVAAAVELSAIVDRAAGALVRDAWEWIGAELPRRKAARAILAFDDLLGHLDRALGGPTRGHDPADDASAARLAAALQRRFPAILIDEFQDTDPIQYRIVRAIVGAAVPDGPPPALLLIGDPKQAIYAFRGADIHTYREAVDLSARERWTLEHNWRSDAALIGAVNHLFHRHGRPFLHEWIPFEPIRPKPGDDGRPRIQGAGGAPVTPLELLHFVPPDAEPDKAASKGDVERALPRAVAADIARLLASGVEVLDERVPPGAAEAPGWRRATPGDVAVLVRANRQAAAMRRALQALGIPSVLQSDLSVFETPEAEDMARLLEALANPTSASAVRAALATPALGRDASELDALGADGAAWDAEGERFGAWHRTWVEGGFIQAFRRCLADAEVPARLLGQPGGERALTNLLHLAELLHGAATERRLGPRGLIRWLARARSGDEDVAAGEAAQLRLERDAEAVTLATVHRSKGLEYPIAYVPFAWSAATARDGALAFRDAEAGGEPTYSLRPTPAQRDAAQLEALAEDLRLLYVALTRARHACRVVWGAISGAGESALGYLLHPTGPERDDEAAWRAACVETARKGVVGGPEAARAALDAVASTVAPTADGPCIGVRALPHGGGGRWQPTDDVPAALSAQSPPEPRRAAWRSSSYSALIRDDGDAVPVRDHDALVEADDEEEPFDGTVPSGRTGAGAAATDAVDAARRDALDGRPPEDPWERTVPLADFPAGARPGVLVHRILETMRFHADAATRRHAIERALERESLTPGSGGHDAGRAEALAVAVSAALDVPLDGGGLRLRDIRRHDRLTEMAFTLPVARGEARVGERAWSDPGEGAAPLTAAALAGALEAAPGPGMPRGYPARLRRLGFAPLAGYLSGFVDLAFRRGGRWFVVDWKTNRLGDRYRHYRREALDEAMVHHHYVLQYHLYVVALHTYLRRRQPGYDYDAHFGGVYYLFLRGLDPDLGPAAGVFADRPPRALVERLDAALRGGGP